MTYNLNIKYRSNKNVHTDSNYQRKQNNPVKTGFQSGIILNVNYN